MRQANALASNAATKRLLAHADSRTLLLVRQLQFASTMRVLSVDILRIIVSADMGENGQEWSGNCRKPPNMSIGNLLISVTCEG